MLNQKLKYCDVCKEYYETTYVCKECFDLFCSECLSDEGLCGKCEGGYEEFNY